LNSARSPEASNGVPFAFNGRVAELNEAPFAFNGVPVAFNEAPFALPKSFEARDFSVSEFHERGF
jgi:hypothetical protein